MFESKSKDNTEDCSAIKKARFCGLFKVINGVWIDFFHKPLIGMHAPIEFNS